jgi:hypothetical protein
MEWVRMCRRKSCSHDNPTASRTHHRLFVTEEVEMFIHVREHPYTPPQTADISHMKINEYLEKND